MLATQTQQTFLALEEKTIGEMSLQEIQAELASLAPHIGRIHQAIAQQQAHLETMQDRARQLVRAAKSHNMVLPAGFQPTEKIDVHVVGGPTYIEHMLRDWRNLVVDALEINPHKLAEKITPLVTEKDGHLDFLEGINLPLVPRKIEILNFDYGQLAALPLPSPEIAVKPEEVKDPLDESLKKA